VEFSLIGIRVPMVRRPIQMAMTAKDHPERLVAAVELILPQGVDPTEFRPYGDQGSAVITWTLIAHPPGSAVGEASTTGPVPWVGLKGLPFRFRSPDAEEAGVDALVLLPGFSAGSIAQQATLVAGQVEKAEVALELAPGAGRITATPVWPTPGTGHGQGVSDPVPPFEWRWMEGSGGKRLEFSFLPEREARAAREYWNVEWLDTEDQPRSILVGISRGRPPEPWLYR
jgi:hypothetical protein